MTIQITPANFANQAISAGSRYAKSKAIYYGEQKTLTFETYLKTEYIPTGKENITIISKGVEYRPDLVSYDYYGHVDNWWKIMEANGMKDIWDFKAGTTIILPDVSVSM